MKIFNGALLTGCAAGALLLFALPAIAQTMPQSTATFTGIDVSPNSAFYFMGGTLALNGNLNKEGYLLRGSAGYGGYNYLSGSGVGEVDGETVHIDAMLGYQFKHDGFRYSGFVGGDYGDTRLSPDDPGNPIRGTRFGFKVLGEVSTDKAKPYYVNFIGSYGTSFDSYWTRARVGYNFGSFVLGPEASVSGNSAYFSNRLGAFMHTDFKVSGVPTRFSLGAGHQKAESDFGTQPQGTYVNANVSFGF